MTLTVRANRARERFSDYDLFKAAVAEDLPTFVRYAFSVVAPAKQLKWGWHLDAMCHKLAQVARGDCKRLIVCVPPRNLKSICASVALPAYVLGRNPSERIVCASYSDQLAKTHANDFRLLAGHGMYQDVFRGMRIDPRKNTEREIMTTARGKRLATSIEGTLTGLGGNLIVIDDPLKPGDVHSRAAREKALEWYRSTLITHGDDKRNTRIVLVMQRVHTEDLAGYLMEQDGYEVLNLPAIVTETASYDLGDGRRHHRKVGDVLNPEHEPQDVLDEIRREMGPVAFSAQYQQAPVPPGGLIVKREWIKERVWPNDYDSRDKTIISWDIALSETEGRDYSVGIVAVRRGETFHILQVLRGRWEFPALKQKIIDLKRRYAGSTLLIEESPISKGLIQTLRENSISAVAIRPETDKESRLVSQLDLFQAGSVTFQGRAPWLPELKSELLAFPGGKHDDQVDALSQLLQYGRLTWSQRASSGWIRGG